MLPAIKSSLPSRQIYIKNSDGNTIARKPITNKDVAFASSMSATLFGTIFNQSLFGTENQLAKHTRNLLELSRLYHEGSEYKTPIFISENLRIFQGGREYENPNLLEEIPKETERFWRDFVYLLRGLWQTPANSIPDGHERVTHSNIESLIEGMKKLNSDGSFFDSPLTRAAMIDPYYFESVKVFKKSLTELFQTARSVGESFIFLPRDNSITEQNAFVKVFFQHFGELYGQGLVDNGDLFSRDFGLTLNTLSGKSTYHLSEINERIEKDTLEITRRKGKREFSGIKLSDPGFPTDSICWDGDGRPPTSITSQITYPNLEINGCEEKGVHSLYIHPGAIFPGINNAQSESSGEREESQSHSQRRSYGGITKPFYLSGKGLEGAASPFVKSKSKKQSIVGYIPSSTIGTSHTLSETNQAAAPVITDTQPAVAIEASVTTPFGSVAIDPEISPTTGGRTPLEADLRVLESMVANVSGANFQQQGVTIEERTDNLLNAIEQEANELAAETNFVVTPTSAPSSISQALPNKDIRDLMSVLGVTPEDFENIQLQEDQQVIPAADHDQELRNIGTELTKFFNGYTPNGKNTREAKRKINSLIGGFIDNEAFARAAGNDSAQDNVISFIFRYPECFDKKYFTAIFGKEIGSACFYVTQFSPKAAEAKSLASALLDHIPGKEFDIQKLTRVQEEHPIHSLASLITALPSNLSVNDKGELAFDAQPVAMFTTILLQTTFNNLDRHEKQKIISRINQHDYGWGRIEKKLEAKLHSTKVGIDNYREYFDVLNNNELNLYIEALIHKETQSSLENKEMLYSSIEARIKRIIALGSSNDENIHQIYDDIDLLEERDYPLKEQIKYWESICSFVEVNHQEAIDLIGEAIRIERKKIHKEQSSPEDGLYDYLNQSIGYKLDYIDYSEDLITEEKATFLNTALKETEEILHKIRPSDPETQMQKGLILCELGRANEGLDILINGLRELSNTQNPLALRDVFLYFSLRCADFCKETNRKIEAKEFYSSTLISLTSRENQAYSSHHLQRFLKKHLPEERVEEIVDFISGKEVVEIQTAQDLAQQLQYETNLADQHFASLSIQNLEALKQELIGASQGKQKTKALFAAIGINTQSPAVFVHPIHESIRTREPAALARKLTPEQKGAIAIHYGLSQDSSIDADFILNAQVANSNRSLLAEKIDSMVEEKRQANKNTRTYLQNLSIDQLEALRIEFQAIDTTTNFVPETLGEQAEAIVNIQDRNVNHNALANMVTEILEQKRANGRTNQSKAANISTQASTRVNANTNSINIQTPAQFAPQYLQPESLSNAIAGLKDAQLTHLFESIFTLNTNPSESKTKRLLSQITGCKNDEHLTVGLSADLERQLISLDTNHLLVGLHEELAQALTGAEENTFAIAKALYGEISKRQLSLSASAQENLLPTEVRARKTYQKVSTVFANQGATPFLLNDLEQLLATVNKADKLHPLPDFHEQKAQLMSEILGHNNKTFKDKDTETKFLQDLISEATLAIQYEKSGQRTANPQVLAHLLLLRDIAYTESRNLLLAYYDCKERVALLVTDESTDTNLLYSAYRRLAGEADATLKYSEVLEAVSSAKALSEREFLADNTGQLIHARALLRSGDPEKALEIIEREKLQGNRLKESLILLEAQCLMKQNKYTEANISIDELDIHGYRTEFKDEDTQKEYFLIAAEIKSKVGEHQKAIDFMNKYFTKHGLIDDKVFERAQYKLASGDKVGAYNDYWYYTQLCDLADEPHESGELDDFLLRDTEDYKEAQTYVNKADEEFYAQAIKAGIDYGKSLKSDDTFDITSSKDPNAKILNKAISADNYLVNLSNQERIEICDAMYLLVEKHPNNIQVVAACCSFMNTLDKSNNLFSAYWSGVLESLFPQSRRSHTLAEAAISIIDNLDLRVQSLAREGHTKLASENNDKTILASQEALRKFPQNTKIPDQLFQSLYLKFIFDINLGKTEREAFAELNSKWKQLRRKQATISDFLKALSDKQTRNLSPDQRFLASDLQILFLEILTNNSLDPQADITALKEMLIRYDSEDKPAIDVLKRELLLLGSQDSHYLKYPKKLTLYNLKILEFIYETLGEQENLEQISKTIAIVQREEQQNPT